jgi:hypothetical protein
MFGVLGRTAAACVIGLALACALGMLGGRAQMQPQDARMSLFARCDGQPCWMGIVPGVTPWTQAERIVTAAAEHDDKRLIMPMGARGDVQVYRSIDPEWVGRMYVLLPYDEAIDAGWIIQRFGVPCGVSIYFHMNMATLRYPNLLANVQLEARGLHVHSPVVALQFSDPHFVFESQPDPCVDNITSRQMLNSAWHGFARVSAYVRAMQARAAG